MSDLKTEKTPEEKLALEVEEDFLRRREERRTLERGWQLNMNFVCGNQYCGLDAAGDCSPWAGPHPASSRTASSRASTRLCFFMYILLSSPPCPSALTQNGFCGILVILSKSERFLKVYR